MTSRRSRRGAIIAFSTVLAIALVVIGVGFVCMLMMMGGQHEIKNAVDAGMLNTGKQLLDNVTIPLLGDANQQCFLDVTNDIDANPPSDDGKVSLRRINRVWAKAILMGINADAMTADGNAGSGPANADLAFQGANTISTNLSGQLNTAANLYGFFMDFATANNVRMIGNTAQTSIVPGTGWQTSLMDRMPMTKTAVESNITVNGSAASNFNMPANYNLNSTYLTGETRNPLVPSGQAFTFLKGYTAMTFAGNQYWQVPFQYDQKPRTVSGVLFNQSTNATNPLSWPNAVPNAYSGVGAATENSGSGEQATSWVLTNPRQCFQMGMPHSFLHIHCDQMYTHFMFFPTGYPPVEFGTEQQYYYETTEQTGEPMPGGGILCATVTPTGVSDIGMDVTGATLDQVIFGPPFGDTAKLETEMVNRINEMITKVGQSYSAVDLHALLANPATIGYLEEGQTDFYIYSPDGQTLSLVPYSIATATPFWLAGMQANMPDGTETQLVNDAMVPAPIEFTPEITPDPDCVETVDLGWGTWDKNLYWWPGTGYNGCLGQVRVTRWTDVYSLGVCVAVPP